MAGIQRLVAACMGTALACFGIARAVDAEMPEVDREGIEFFEKKIRPVLVERCYECHSSKSKMLEGSLSLETRAGLLKGGDLGPSIVPGDPAKSLLYQAIRYQDKSLQMPPKERLPDSVVADFESWIQRGAHDPRTAPPVTGASYAVDIEAARERWPYTPPIEPVIPAITQTDWARNPIDHFILAKLEERGLRPVGDTEKRTLLRRVTYDLIGLPPAPADIDAFLADESPNALAHVVDRLLDSPHYGERWGRHWLDVVRYADTAGDNSDYPIPQMVKYRDWVIAAFNADKPYDQFIREQLAGDLLPAADSNARRQQIIATGYIANARRFGSRVSDYPQHLTIEDTIDNLGKAFLGLSINCARCHNHKFDPITAEDYYAIYGIFHSTRYPWPGIELDKQQRDLVPLAPESEVATAMEERQKRLDKLSAALKEAEDQKKAAQKAVTELSKRVVELKKEGDKKQADGKEAEADLAKAEKSVTEKDSAVKAAKKKRDEAEKSPLPFEQAYAVAEGKKIENGKVQLKGDPARLGNVVPRRFLQVLGGQQLPSGATGSGRRELADWISDAKNPLTARVMVNRLWHHHFGRGIVPTPNDFGKQGKLPSHPELLDYLALRLIENGWSIKAMHRLIVLSRTYQLSSQDDAAALATDPANELFWRYNRRRLDAESIRDTLLAVGGTLDNSAGGEHAFPPQKDWDFTQHKPFKAVYDTNRRSVYLMTQRISRHPFLAIFDGPDTGASTPRRTTSTTTLQALYLLNDPFVHDQAARFAARLVIERGDNASRIDLAYRTLFARPPTEEELKLGQDYLLAGSAEEAWPSYVRALVRTNEFVYLD